MEQLTEHIEVKLHLQQMYKIESLQQVHNLLTCRDVVYDNKSTPTTSPQQMHNKSNKWSSTLAGFQTGRFVVEIRRSW